MERMGRKDPREEVGNKACIVGRIDKKRTKWAGHMVRLIDEKFTENI